MDDKGELKKFNKVTPPVKELSNLKFSDFIGSGHMYDHNKESVWEAIGVEDKDSERLRDMVIKIQKESTDRKISKLIEEMLKMDIPAPWKAMSFIKVGESMLKSHLMNIVKDAPIPDEIKMLVNFTIKSSGVG